MYLKSTPIPHRICIERNLFCQQNFCINWVFHRNNISNSTPSSSSPPFCPPSRSLMSKTTYATFEHSSLNVYGKSDSCAPLLPIRNCKQKLHFWPQPNHPTNNVTSIYMREWGTKAELYTQSIYSHQDLAYKARQSQYPFDEIYAQQNRITIRWCQASHIWWSPSGCMHL